MTPEETRTRLLRFLRRMPCDLAYNAQGFAFYMGTPDKATARAIEEAEVAGLVEKTRPARRPFYRPVRASCIPGKRCKRAACRLLRESKRLRALADKVAAS